jgi:hypothetical protein
MHEGCLMLDASYLLDSRDLETITFVLEEKIGTLRPNEIRIYLDIQMVFENIFLVIFKVFFYLKI